MPDAHVTPVTTPQVPVNPNPNNLPVVNNPPVVDKNATPVPLITPPLSQSTPSKVFNTTTGKEEDNFVFNSKMVQDKLEAVKENLQSYVGKPGYNSYYYMTEKVNPLQQRLLTTDRSKELQDAIMALDEGYVPEVSGNTAKENRDRGCIEPQSAGRSHAIGQIVKPGQS